MQNATPSLSTSWRVRARALILRLVLGRERSPRGFIAWAEMRPIDFEGEDTSLTEAELAHLR